MAGMIGMAQTLAVYHYGYHTLKNRLVQYHEPTREPSDAEAVLEWGLDTPFTSQDKPSLAVAMAANNTGGHSSISFTALRQVDFSRVPSIGSTCMAMQGTATALLCGFVFPTMDLQS